ncbi:hypothetical protein GHK86_05185, partial [Acidimicrobiaceae bacterium USS-CC1]|nr:hypothetical protein [Acidiferrimicrobium australe]
FPRHGHPDRTPSLRLYLDDDRYYCFGCNARGDIIQWAQDAADLTVTDALRLLDSHQPIPNAWAGAAPQPPSTQVSPAGSGPDPTRTPPERVHAALDAAWTHYTTGEHHGLAVGYLARRGIDITVLERLTGRAEAGATGGRHSLVETLTAEGFAAEELVDAGLARWGSEPRILIDAYRDRMLVPVRDETGRVCGLVGRYVGDRKAPKYLNPPRTATYDKSINLYRPLPAPTCRLGRVVVVEGTLDALAIAVASVRAGTAERCCPVTQSGRELSAVQVRSVLRLSQRPPVLALDGDSAGREATSRLLGAFAAAGVRPTVVSLPEGEDPASLLARDGLRSLRSLDGSRSPVHPGASATPRQPACSAAVLEV